MDSNSDDLYHPSDSFPTVGQPKAENAEVKMEDVDEEQEEGEEIEEDNSDDVSGRPSFLWTTNLGGATLCWTKSSGSHF